MEGADDAADQQQDSKTAVLTAKVSPNLPPNSMYPNMSAHSFPLDHGNLLVMHRHVGTLFLQQ